MRAIVAGPVLQGYFSWMRWCGGCGGNCHGAEVLCRDFIFFCYVEYGMFLCRVRCNATVVLRKMWDSKLRTSRGHMTPSRHPSSCREKNTCPGKITDIGHVQGHVQDMSRTCETKILTSCRPSCVSCRSCLKVLLAVHTHRQCAQGGVTCQRKFCRACMADWQRVVSQAWHWYQSEICHRWLKNIK